MCIRRRRRGVGLGPKIVRAFLDFNAAVYRQVLEGLGEAAGPAHRGADRALYGSQSKEKFLAVLRQKARACLQISGLAMASGFDGHRGADRVAIAFLAAQAEYDAVAKVFHRVAQHAQLRRVPVFQDDFEPPVVVEVGQHEGAAVVGKSRPTAPETSENVPSRLLA